MKLTLESTSKIVTVNGVPARIWEGATESGISVIAFISRVAVERHEDTRQFDRELQETRAPTVEAAAFPPRMIL